MIVGTAGHIDHGKTALVRALTGVATDRLKEERERGISIELGYAYAPLADGTVLGIVDVPGHERFVRTMVAGAVGIDHALLVVAADDGVMPQTREHLAILDLLGVHHGSVALNKADRVPPERLAEVRAEIASLLADTPLAGAPVFETVATADADPGVAALREHLEAVARERSERSADGGFRLAVDRVFTLAGQGTAVTGTVFAGRVRVGDSLQHSASGQTVRVRSIHAQNQPAEEGRAGQRCALVLAGIDRETIQRGDWIAAPATLQRCERLDARIRLLPDAPALAHWAPVHVHVGTSHHVAHLVPLDAQPPAAGASARVQLVFETPVWALPGDRLILRNAQASRTIGGGRIVDVWAPERRRRSAERLAWLDALEAAQAEPTPAAVTRLLALAPAGLARSRLLLLLGQPLPALPDAVTLALAGDDALCLASSVWQRWRERVLAVLADFHARSPDEPGLNAARLRRMVQPGADDGAQAWWPALLDALLADGALARQGAWLHLPGHAVNLSADEEALAQRLRPALAAGGADPPWVRDLAASCAAPEAQVRSVLRKLARRGELQQVVKDLFYPEAAIARLLAQLDELAAAAPRGEVGAAAFRDASGLGRKRAIQVLEHFDRAGYTRRVRDARVRRDRPDAAKDTDPGAMGDAGR
ncbi:selenocysteine-specific translation elongation factor [Rubrivivax gelatinosus]|uniref:Selenocysteine-specific elongation factor n=1 Tax=Rubrivivax gelatinosus TaxID=28068 RepID=A0ABS1DTN5_RUBGE|nr:selenocysteine-specific translation elongation factor [Rubrivivax gelatinosus]MBK1713361.1 selenocysteine-specific translation elongation factor [Rubrivivax gelatinosus]